IAAMRSVEARMSNRELQKAAGLKNAISFREHADGFRNIHQAHECGGKIKSGVGKWQVDCACCCVIDAQRGFFFSRLRVSDEDFGDIYSLHALATFCQETSVVAFATANIQARQAFDVWQHRKERGRIE